jgi:hypothetical protein
VDYDLGAAVASAVRALRNPENIEDTLSAIAAASKDSLPGFDEVGISTIDNHGNIHTRAGTGELVWELDQIQYELGQGPCVDSLHKDPVVAVPGIQHEERWPQYVPQAVRRGLKAQLGMRLYLDHEGTLGCLNMYSTTTEDIHVDAEGIAGLFATHAALALGFAREVDGLHEAMSRRKTIGMAIGMLMAEHAIGEDAAFALLVRISSHTNVKVRDIATRMVDEANARNVPEAPGPAIEALFDRDSPGM